jgi:hypothetical protein
VEIEHVLGGMRITGARSRELISSALWDNGEPDDWIELEGVKANPRDISGRVIFHSVDGDYVYRLHGWAAFLPKVAVGELVTAPRGRL